MEYTNAINIVNDIIRSGLRHKNYQRTVDLANEYKTIITGDGVEKYMKQFPKRETEEEFKDRCKLTINITETVCGNIIDPQKKLSRSNSIERTFQYTDKNQEKYKKLTEILNGFYEGDKSVDRYMAKSWIETNNIDPNTLVVVDWVFNQDGRTIRPYPVEYPAHKVYHFQKINGLLNWACVHRDETIFEPEKYILYSKNYTVIYSRKKFDESYKWTYTADLEYYKDFNIKTFQGGEVALFKESDDSFWEISIATPHNLNEVPAFFAGYVTDLLTRETYLSSIHKAMPILKKLIKANGELDWTMLTHAFPQKIQYTTPCPQCNGRGSLISGEKCDNCNGEGHDPKDVQKSALDVIKVPRPREGDDMIDLSKLVYYVASDVRLLEFIDKFTDKLTKRCKEAVYNSEVFSRSDVAETATSKNIDLQNVYDALYDMAMAYSEKQNFLVRLIAKITDLDKGLEYHMRFRKDFKMKSLTDLYEDLKVVGDSNADEFVRKGIEDDIAKIMYEDDPHQLAKYETLNYFFPFNGKNKKEIEIIVTGTSMISKKVKTLWANFAWIFDEIEIEWKDKPGDFYKIERDKQREVIDKKVTQILEEIESQKEDINVGEALSQLGQQAAGLEPQAQ